MRRLNMQDYLNQLSDKLIYDSKKFKDNTLIITCHICKDTSHKVHSYFVRKINDINYGNYKVILYIKNYNYYIDRSSFKITSYKPDFIDGRSYRTKRLTDYILNNIKESSAIGLERNMKNITKISDSTIIRIVKKKSTQ